MRPRIIQENSGLALLLPTLLIMALFSIFPLIEGIRLSFTDANLLNKGARGVGLANFAEDFAVIRLLLKAHELSIDQVEAFAGFGEEVPQQLVH